MQAIARSRQFPFRFFSAYEAVDVDLNSLVAGPDGQLGFPKRTGQAGGKGKGGKGGAKGGKGGRGPPQPPKVTVPTVMPTAELLEQYRSALDTAVKLATMHNIRPIHGSTIVMCNVSEAMEVSASGARGMGASGLLVSLHMCEGKCMPACVCVRAWKVCASDSCPLCTSHAPCF